MADISKINVNGIDYNVNDTTAEAAITKETARAQAAEEANATAISTLNRAVAAQGTNISQNTADITALKDFVYKDFSYETTSNELIYKDCTFDVSLSGYTPLAITAVRSGTAGICFYGWRLMPETKNAYVGFTRLDLGTIQARVLICVTVLYRKNN